MTNMNTPTRPDAPPAGDALREAAVRADFLLHFDLRRMIEWGPDYNQAVKDVADRLRTALAAAPAPQPEWNGPGEKPHEYSPDYQAMGDCRICGHVWEDHQTTPAPQPVATDDRSFPDAADGRPLPPMADQLMAAGLNHEDARFVARMLRDQGYYLIRADDIGWPEIGKLNAVLHGGQAVTEDAGGFFARAIMALFGKKSDPVTTYQQAARALLSEVEKKR